MGAWSQKDKEAFARGARGESPAPAPAKAPSPVEPEEGEMAKIDDGVTKMQAANASDPSLKDRLNAVAAARAKFYGQK